ncbi:MAG: Enoyl-CoA hydratase/isomerase [Solirubrobacterales bacterium]|jgi:enoyl-CoA hydratase|nr:Enoyl-CoA hydratase/isomerase [Solirubrobacterales bacterium]
MPAFSTLRYDVAPSGVATIALDQPDTRNALSDELLSDLIAAFRAARDDDAVRCVVLTSTHETTFSAGGNLAGFAADVPLVHKHFATERFPALFTLIGRLGKPTVCAANGHVLAGALGLALACDLVVAKEGATFGTPEINVGVFPFMIMALIYRNVGRKKTTELLLLGDRIDAREAERIGLVNRVVAAAEFDGAVADWAQKLAAKSPVMMKLGKDALYRQQDMALEEALDFLRSQLTIAFSTEDLQEGVKAFFEKREPRWTGR